MAKTLLDLINDAEAGRGGDPVIVVDTVSAQTLTNKTLTTPSITNPGITGPVPATITTTPVTLAPAAHANRMVVINLASGGTYTLPAATGTGNRYRLVVGTTLTSGSLVVQVASATDYFRGAAFTVGAAQASFLTANTGTVATESDTVTFNRSTTGLGTIGDYLEFEDIAAGVWSLELMYASSGSAATPFSVAV